MFIADDIRGRINSTIPEVIYKKFDDIVNYFLIFLQYLQKSSRVLKTPDSILWPGRLLMLPDDRGGFDACYLGGIGRRQARAVFFAGIKLKK